MTSATRCWRDLSPVARRHIWTLLASAIGAALLMVGAAAVLKFLVPEGHPAVRALIALSPLLPFVLMCVSMMRLSRSLDELQSRVQLEALGLSVVLTSIIVTAWGQLQKAGILPEAEMTWAWIVMAFCYGACSFVVARRYY